MKRIAISITLFETSGGSMLQAFKSCIALFRQAPEQQGTHLQFYRELPCDLFHEPMCDQHPTRNPYLPCKLPKAI